MSTLLHVLLWVFAILFVLAAHVRFWRVRYRLVLGADATYYARANDGWRLAIHHYRGGEGEPVLLCHGLGANGFNVDLGSRLSLARHLAERGFDVWSVELRGVGFSRRRDTTREAGGTWSFDDHVHRDLPAAIDRVLAESGQERLHWVGHSLGGMAIYAYLATRDDPRVASLCTVGSPAAFLGHSRLQRLWPLLRFLGVLPTIRTRAFIGLGIPFYKSFPISYITHHGRNLATRDVRRAMANLVEPIASRTLRQVSRWLQTGSFASYDGQTDYLSKMGRIAAPACVLAGSGDAIARPENVRAGYEALGSALKVMHVLGREGGETNDYGHGDLLIGTNAPTEVYPRISRWLEDRRAGRARPAGRVAAVLASGARRAMTVTDAATPSDAVAPEVPSTSTGPRPAVSGSLPAAASKHAAGLQHAPAGSGSLHTRANVYDPFLRRRRERWAQRGGRPPVPLVDAAGRPGREARRG